jgi:hypothetical protein
MFVRVNDSQLMRGICNPGIIAKDSAYYSRD